LLSCTYVYFGLRVASHRTVLAARQVLLTSIVYLPLLYVLMMVDRPSL
jgi:heme O synthase-like polyprenyltransferase